MAYIPRDKRSMVKLIFFFFDFRGGEIKMFFLDLSTVKSNLPQVKGYFSCIDGDDIALVTQIQPHARKLDVHEPSWATAMWFASREESLHAREQKGHSGLSFFY